MATGDLPAVARRRVRLALRDAREKNDLTQGQVAEAMEWSLSKVMRIESGEVTISPNDLRPLLSYLGVADQSQVDALLRDAKASRRRQMWWDDTQFREHLTPALRQLIQYEVEATVVRHFYATLIPGRLQTRPYAEAILRSYRNALPEEVIKARIDARVRRRSDLLARRPPPRINLLLDESVLHREVGGRQVMGEQLSDLLKLTNEKRLLIRVVPYDLEDAPLPMLGALEILDLGSDDAVIYRESLVTDEIVEDKTVIAGHREVFENLWSAAHDEVTSAELIGERVKFMRSSARKSPG
jgi:transcriptional regulator with XRE-family HTH domain